MDQVEADQALELLLHDLLVDHKRVHKRLFSFWRWRQMLLEVREEFLLLLL